MVEVLTEEEKAIAGNQGLSSEDIAEIERKREEEKATPPPEGEQTPPAGVGSGAPAGSEEAQPTAEDEIARLTEELESVKAADAGKVKDLVHMRDEVRYLKTQVGQPQPQLQPPPQVQPFPEVADDDYLTGAQLKTLKTNIDAQLKKVTDDALNTASDTKWFLSEKFAKSKHEDYEEKYAEFQRIADANPLLWNIASFEADPCEYIYERALLESNKSGEPKKEVVDAKKEVVDKITKTKPKFPSGSGGGGSPTATTLEQAAQMSPSEWAQLPEADRAKLLRESGG